MLKIELDGDRSAETTTPMKFMIKRIKARKEQPRLASIHRMGAEWYIKHKKETLLFPAREGIWKGRKEHPHLRCVFFYLFIY